MFQPSSRYADLETKVFTDANGREIRYVTRRFLPEVKGFVIRQHTVTENDRLDNLAARYLGDPEVFWQLADINNAVRAEELTDELGRRLIVGILPGTGPGTGFL